MRAQHLSDASHVSQQTHEPWEVLVAGQPHSLLNTLHVKYQDIRVMVLQAGRQGSRVPSLEFNRVYLEVAWLSLAQFKL